MCQLDRHICTAGCIKRAGCDTISCGRGTHTHVVVPVNQSRYSGSPGYDIMWLLYKALMKIDLCALSYLKCVYLHEASLEFSSCNRMQRGTPKQEVGWPYYGISVTVSTSLCYA